MALQQEVFEVLNVPARACPRECRQLARQGSIFATAQLAQTVTPRSGTLGRRFRRC